MMTTFGQRLAALFAALVLLSVVVAAPVTAKNPTWSHKDAAVCRQEADEHAGCTSVARAFYVDGVNTTNLEYGFQGKELNFEFIQEVNVKTGGYEAEFGRATGGIVNVITKSGGNELTGDVFAYRDSDSLQAEAEPVVDTTLSGFTRRDFGADVGGYLMRDKLWFFAAYDRVKNSTDNILPEGPLAGDIETSNSDRDLGSAKLTWNATGTQSFVLTFLQDPRIDTGAMLVVSPFGRSSASGRPSTM